MKSFSFKNGDTIDAIGLGTWKSDPGEAGKAVKEAIRAGYRHIDCAAIYGNEDDIGRALSRLFEDGEVKREELFITSKLWNSAHKKNDVIPALKKTLDDLKLDYLDLYLMHWPVAFRPGLTGAPKSEKDVLPIEEIPITETWEAMLQAKKQGLIKHAGVSNFSTVKLDELIKASPEAPEMNQVELHPYLQQEKLLKFCKSHDILVTAYSPLGSRDRPDGMKAKEEPSLLENPVINEIADKHGATPAQVLIKWAVQRDTIVIPKSSNPDRIRQNLESAKLQLSEEDMKRIRALDQHFRYLPTNLFRTKSGMYENIFDD